MTETTHPAVMMRCPDYFEAMIARIGDTDANRKMLDDAFKSVATDTTPPASEVSHISGAMRDVLSMADEWFEHSGSQSMQSEKHEASIKAVRDFLEPHTI